MVESLSCTRVKYIFFFPQQNVINNYQQIYSTNNDQVINKDIVNEEETISVSTNEDPPTIEEQPVPIPTKTLTFEEMLAELSSVDDSFSKKEAKLLRMMESIERITANVEAISEEEQKRRDTERLLSRTTSSEGQIESFLNSMKVDKTKISSYMFYLLLLLLGALSFSLYLNRKLGKKLNKDVPHAREEKQSVGIQTYFQKVRAPPVVQDLLMEESEDEYASEDISDGSFSIPEAKKTKKKRFGFNVRKCFCHCIKWRNKKRSKTIDSEKENETSDEGEDLLATRPKKKRFGLNVRKSFFRCLKRRNKKKKKSLTLPDLETSEASEGNLDESLDVTEESYEETSSVSTEITDDTSYETVESEPINITAGRKKKRGFNILLCCKECKTLGSETRETTKGKKKRLGLKLRKCFYCYKLARNKGSHRNKKRLWQWRQPSDGEEESLYETPDEVSIASNDTTDGTSYETIESDESVYVLAREKKHRGFRILYWKEKHKEEKAKRDKKKRLGFKVGKYFHRRS
ncbi:uncharacterized protein LOC116409825 isoform X2 [Xenopus tropicalis]|uniref:Uncharacterized protein LOC116409825 isoform X2 n=1 Tax=Xenopus tropicalis TaxID=8364 RepID=A0A8J1JBT0_XENTR|nr:uncharacterized protein LOC116409825 isoform X2 [Xenopus tropicalis]